MLCCAICARSSGCSPPKSTMKYEDCNYYYRPQRSCGQGYVFTRVCDSVHGGGGVSGEPPWTRENPPPRHQGDPLDQGEPPRDQADPPDQGDTPPGTRQTPPPPGPRRPPPLPPTCSETPPGPGRPPQDQGDPPGRENPPPPGRRLQHTVNERPVRILLECILVIDTIMVPTIPD